MFLENDLSDAIDLNGAWQFKLADGRWRSIDVPSAWEASHRNKVTEGPAIYRRAFHLDHTEGWLLLEADAISFAAIVRVNGQPAGEHTGMWSRFQVDITPFARVAWPRDAPTVSVSNRSKTRSKSIQLPVRGAIVLTIITTSIHKPSAW